MLRIGVLACLLLSSCQSGKTPKQIDRPLYNVTESWRQVRLGEETLFTNEGDVHLIPIADPPTIQQMLIGGRPADPKDFPASMYASMSGARCTSTLVGPRVLLIAAHCVGNGRNAVFPVNGVQYRSTCEHHPDYRGNDTADWALCLVDQDVPGVAYESINLDPDFVKVGDEVLLTGYGCLDSRGRGGNDGIYRIGEAKVTKVPTLDASNHDIVTEGGAALCFGDSGGPAFKIVGAERKVISVNSRGDIKKWSYLSATATTVFKSYITAYTASKAVAVCGVNPAAKGCRSGEPGPGYPPLPGNCKPDLDKFTLCLFGNPRHAVTEPQVCRETFASLSACEEVAERKE